MHHRSSGYDCPASSPSALASRSGPWRARHLMFATLCISLLSFGSAVADEAPEPTSGQATEQAESQAKPERNGKICQIEEVTGSLMKKRVCKTPEQWAARESAGKELVREMDRKPLAAKGE